MENLVINTHIVVNNETYIERFLKYLDVSQNTINEYAFGLKGFFNYCKNNNIDEVKREDIINFRNWLQEQGKEVGTINLYLASVKSFFKWLNYEGVYKNITENIKSLKTDFTHKREPLSVEQIKQVISNCENIKQKIIIMLTVSCGLRCNELTHIQVSDFKIRQDKVCLYVLGKARQGLKLDYVVVSDELYEMIKSYIEEYNIKDYLFLSESNNNYGRPLSNRAIRNMVNKLFEKVGIKSEQIVFHSLRHSFCNISLENNINIIEVSKAMRHKSLNTTMRYVKDIEAKNNKCYSTVANLIVD